MAFNEKVVLITGASSGIGAATAAHLSKHGAKLSLSGRNLQNLQEVASKCNKETLTTIADLTLESDVVNLVESTIKRFGKIDVLVNNAGIQEVGSIENTSLQQYDHVMNTNMRSVYQLTMLATPYLIQSKGCVVNVSSVCGLRSFPNILAYSISKAALDQFTKCVALELAPKGVRVNSVNPGVITTNLHKRAGMDDEAYDKFIESSKAAHALGRPGTPQEVACAIAFLASDSATFVTATNLSVDGGKHAMCPR